MNTSPSCTWRQGLFLALASTTCFGLSLAVTAFFAALTLFIDSPVANAQARVHKDAGSASRMLPPLAVDAMLREGFTDVEVRTLNDARCVTWLLTSHKGLVALCAVPKATTRAEALSGLPAMSGFTWGAAYTAHSGGWWAMGAMFNGTNAEFDDASALKLVQVFRDADFDAMTTQALVKMGDRHLAMASNMMGAGYQPLSVVEVSKGPFRGTKVTWASGVFDGGTRELARTYHMRSSDGEPMPRGIESTAMGALCEGGFGKASYAGPMELLVTCASTDALARRTHITFAR